jgi:hypothetical protein
VARANIEELLIREGFILGGLGFLIENKAELFFVGYMKLE